MPKTKPEERPQAILLYDSRISPPLPTRLYKGQDIGEMLAIISTRSQLGVDFAKRLARTRTNDKSAHHVDLELFAKALGYYTWIHALQHRSENGKVILTNRAPHPGKDLIIEYNAEDHSLTFLSYEGENILLYTRH